MRLRDLVKLVLFEGSPNFVPGLHERTGDALKADVDLRQFIIDSVLRGRKSFAADAMPAPTTVGCIWFEQTLQYRNRFGL